MPGDLPPCAHGCAWVADLVVRLAQATGRSERAERVALGLSPEYVPPVPRTPTAAAQRWLTDEFTD